LLWRLARPRESLSAFRGGCNVAPVRRATRAVLTPNARRAYAQCARFF
jgi:hypothetical protein